MVFGLKFRVIREWITLYPFFRRCVTHALSFSRQVSFKYIQSVIRVIIKNQKNHSSDMNAIICFNRVSDRFLFFFLVILWVFKPYQRFIIRVSIISNRNFLSGEYFPDGMNFHCFIFWIYKIPCVGLIIMIV